MTSGINVNMRYISILWSSLLRNNLFGMDLLDFTKWSIMVVYSQCNWDLILTTMGRISHCLPLLPYDPLSLHLGLPGDFFDYRVAFIWAERYHTLPLNYLSSCFPLIFFSIFSFCTPQSFPCQQHWPCPFPWSKLFPSLLFIWPPDVWHHWDHYTQQQFCKL